MEELQSENLGVGTRDFTPPVESEVSQFQNWVRDHLSRMYGAAESSPVPLSVEGAEFQRLQENTPLNSELTRLVLGQVERILQEKPTAEEQTEAFFRLTRELRRLSDSNEIKSFLQPS